jgi:hypothetical protein
MSAVRLDRAAGRSGREGGVLLIVLVVVLAVGCFLLYRRAKTAEAASAAAAPAAAETPPSPFAGPDAVLADTGGRKAADTRAETVKMELSAMKTERNKVDAAVRDAAASLKSREADISRIRSDIASAKTRIASLKEEWEEDPSDEALKTKLYEAAVKLRGGEGIEGLETRLLRATADLESARARSDALRRRLGALDSAIATAESQGRTVVDFVRFEEADAAAGAARGHGKAIAGLAESTEGAAIGVAAEDEAVKARRDASLEALLEGL